MQVSRRSTAGERTLGAALLLTLALARPESAGAELRRVGDDLRVETPQVSAVFTRGRRLSGLYRTMGMNPQAGHPFEFAAGDMGGIPIALMPEDRPFQAGDFAKARDMILVAVDPRLAARIREIATTNLGWRKVAIEGRVLTVREFRCRLHGGGYEGSNVEVVDVEKVEAVYGEVAGAPAEGERAAAEDPSVSEGTVASDERAKPAAFVKVSGGTFLFRGRSARPPAIPEALRQAYARGALPRPDDSGVPAPRTVTVRPFEIGKYEVTRAQWAYAMGESAPGLGGPNHPVTGVTYRQVQEFLRRLQVKTGRKYRLPTEAEWEFAARSGGRKETWAGTSDQSALPAFAWLDANAESGPHPVGEKRPNALGLHDMTGNVWEYVEIGGKDVGPPPRAGFVGRRSYLSKGGGWANSAEGAQIWLQGSTELGSGGDDLTGFRLAR